MLGLERKVVVTFVVVVFFGFVGVAVGVFVVEVDEVGG